MKFLHIKNYLDIPKQEKLEFLKFLNTLEQIKVTNQKVVFNDNSLILELSEDTDFTLAQTKTAAFFKSKKNIIVKLVDKIIQSSNELILIFNDDQEKRIKI